MKRTRFRKAISSRSAPPAKQWLGKLLAYEDGDVTIQSGGEERRFTKKQIASVRLRVEM